MLLISLFGVSWILSLCELKWFEISLSSVLRAAYGISLILIELNRIELKRKWMIYYYYWLEIGLFTFLNIYRLSSALMDFPFLARMVPHMLTVHFQCSILNRQIDDVCWIAAARISIYDWKQQQIENKHSK